MAQTAKSSLIVRVVQLPHAKGLPLPAYQSDDAAGLDLVAAVDEHEPVMLAPGRRAAVPTGLILQLPSGNEGQVRPRSGLAAKHGVTVLNSPGTIDCDYRGEVKVLLVNLGAEPFQIRRGERIAQLIIAPVTRATLRVAAALSSSARGAGGFGSTGTKSPKSKAIPAKRKSTQRGARTAQKSGSKTRS